MKRIAFIIMVILLSAACSTTKEAGSNRAELRKQKKIVEQQIIKKAVESRMYVIKLNKFYGLDGRHLDLVPRNNFIIVNGDIASMSLYYGGRSYSVRPISGINMNGHTLKYQMQSDETKGLYKIQMAVAMGSDKFDVYLTIGDNGNCNVSINNPYIQSATYYGSVVPLPSPDKYPAGKTARM